MCVAGYVSEDISCETARPLLKNSPCQFQHEWRLWVRSLNCWSQDWIRLCVVNNIFSSHVNSLLSNAVSVENPNQWKSTLCVLQQQAEFQLQWIFCLQNLVVKACSSSVGLVSNVIKNIKYKLLTFWSHCVVFQSTSTFYGLTTQDNNYVDSENFQGLFDLDEFQYW